MPSRMPLRRSAACLAIIVIALSALPLVRVASAEGGYPDFYGTVLAVDREQGTITLLTDSEEKVTVDIRDLGTKPFDEGAFAVDNVILLRTRALPDRLLAIGWEQARNGRERFRD
jgi:hypothetical protein